MLFEVGATYFNQTSQDSSAAFVESTAISGLAYGSAKPEQWSADASELDFFEVKAHVDALLGGTSAHKQITYEKAEHVTLHPGQTARILLDGAPVGWLGKLHPKWQQHYSLSKSTFLFELQAEAVLNRQIPSYQEVSKLLPIRRDLAVVVDADLAVNSLLNAVEKANIPLILEVALFDLYQGQGIPENKKSLALSVLMHDTQKTLTDADADTAIANLLSLLQNNFAATLRN
jgi:phenylalanyl-tRNA synthetase beta chain